MNIEPLLDYTKILSDQQCEEIKVQQRSLLRLVEGSYRLLSLYTTTNVLYEEWFPPVSLYEVRQEYYKNSDEWAARLRIWKIEISRKDVMYFTPLQRTQQIWKENSNLPFLITY